ncbi:helix-turn-helix domain-containing protein [Kocuria marina]|uniref:helix-turn-helix domain-containing protein n=1 Tax=Kocuria marina TaxID=223184 RepID=UPI002989DE1B|nr:helix-turn-helix domain-containing protein [Kocuria marina]MCT1735648.1 helix-turn-helix domain-containing protein [Kocuria marina]
MGYMTMNAVNCHAPFDLPKSARGVLRTLAEYADDRTLLAWPSVQTICRENGLFDRSDTNKQIKVLKKAGLIEDAELPPGLGYPKNRVPKCYRLVIHCNEYCFRVRSGKHYAVARPSANLPPLKPGIDDEPPKLSFRVSQTLRPEFPEGYSHTPQDFSEGYSHTPQDFSEGYSHTPQNGSEGYSHTPQDFSEGYSHTPQNDPEGYTRTPQNGSEGYSGPAWGVHTYPQKKQENLTHPVNPSRVNVGQSQATDRPAENGEQDSQDQDRNTTSTKDASWYLAKPQDAEGWKKGTPLHRRISSATIHAAQDAWVRLFGEAPTGSYAGVPKALGKHAGEEAQRRNAGDEETAQGIVQVGMRAVWLLHEYMTAYKATTSHDLLGKSAIRVAFSFHQLLLDGQPCKELRLAAVAAARDGSEAFEMYLTNIHFNGEGGVSTPPWKAANQPTETRTPAPRSGTMSVYEQALAMHRAAQTPASLTTPDGDLTTHRRERITQDDA